MDIHSSNIAVNNYTIGNYCYNRKIGRGSFSKVYKGYHKDTLEKVAIKVVDMEISKHLKTFMEREIEVMKTLNHPNILKLHDVLNDSDENTMYLILEYCQKGDFYKFLNKRALKEKHALRYMIQLANGLQHLIVNNIIHRDLKPQNILLSDDDQIKLTDFGFARYYEINTMVDTLCGSPLYMAPEIMKHKRYTINADLWSVGIIMYEMLVGKVPYSALTHIELLNKIENKPLIIPNFLSENCQDLLTKLLKKNPDERMTWDDFFSHEWFENSIEDSRENIIKESTVIKNNNKDDSDECMDMSDPDNLDIITDDDDDAYNNKSILIDNDLNINDDIEDTIQDNSLKNEQAIKTNIVPSKSINIPIKKNTQKLDGWCQSSTPLFSDNGISPLFHNIEFIMVEHSKNVDNSNDTKNEQDKTITQSLRDVIDYSFCMLKDTASIFTGFQS
jgi:serine/threonine-protein kinase ULK2